MGFVANFVRSPAVQKVRKSLKIWQSYREFKGGNFFETQCTVHPSPNTSQTKLIGKSGVDIAGAVRCVICQVWCRDAGFALYSSNVDAHQLHGRRRRQRQRLRRWTPAWVRPRRRPDEHATKLPVALWWGGGRRCFVHIVVETWMRLHGDQ